MTFPHPPSYPKRHPGRTWAAALAVALTLCAGCEENGTLPDDDDDDTTSEGGVSITLSEVIPTVVTVEWTPAEADVTSAHVEFGLDTEYGVQAPAADQGDGSYSAILIGLKAANEYHLRTAVETPGGTVAGEDHTVTTGAVPPAFPSMEMIMAAPDEKHDGFMLTTLLSQPPVPVVLDTDGDYVWWYEHDEGQPPALSRLTFSVDRESFILQLPAGGVEFEDPDELVRVSLDGTSEEVIEGGIEGHHDYTELPDGTIAMITYDWRMMEDINTAGDAIVELQPDGSVVEIWNIWDHEEYPGLGDYIDSWSHANALDYDPVEDAYYISIRNLHCIYKIDRATGEPLWKMGTEDSDFRINGHGTDFTYYQHQFQVLDDGLLIFDNGDPEGQVSRVVHFTLDESTWNASVEWAYHSVPPLYNYGLGDVHRFENGNTLVTWSTAGQLEEINYDRDVIWRLNIDELGAGFAYTNWLESFYDTP